MSRVDTRPTTSARDYGFAGGGAAGLWVGGGGAAGFWGGGGVGGVPGVGRSSSTGMSRGDTRPTTSARDYGFAGGGAAGFWVAGGGAAGFWVAGGVGAVPVAGGCAGGVAGFAPDGVVGFAVAGAGLAVPL